MDWRRTHFCGAVTEELAGQEVVVNGWVNRRRDLGGMIFVDLRDRFGLVQIVFDPNLLDDGVFAQAEKLAVSLLCQCAGSFNCGLRVRQPQLEDRKGRNPAGPDYSVSSQDSSF